MSKFSTHPVYTYNVSVIGEYVRENVKRYFRDGSFVYFSSRFFDYQLTTQSLIILKISVSSHLNFEDVSRQRNSLDASLHLATK